MFFFYDAADALFEFMQKGGDVLYLIGLLAFLMWFLIFERLWYFNFNHQSTIDVVVQDWSKRSDKKSWNSKAIREMLISQTSSKINLNLTLIKLCVGVAPLLGLFGTITGMMEVFHLLAITGGGDAKAMAGGVSRSTIPAMAGLSVAITGTFASTFLRNKSNREVELLSEHLVSE
ncbi:MAG: MotA/TolQ/ExbB proton channel family protein [SAR86 cluster bacterium]|jgi:biopolymer transport protein ExbB|nr:MotA/TolQ/ExbB proton channel family protein [SAR86 cluster bacterium]